MDISRREKYLHSGFTVNKSNKYINLNLDINALDLMCLYVISDNRNIQRSSVMNLRNLMSIINLDNYKSDTERMKRIDFINKGLHAKLDLGLMNPKIILQEINGGLIGEELLDSDFTETKLSNQEINKINEMVTESLKCSFIYNDIDQLMDLGAKFKMAQYGSKIDVLRKIEAKINEMQTKFRRVKTENATEAMFSLQNGLFENIVTDTYNNVVNPSSRLLCGMQGLNELTSGGFASGRVYMLFGLPGEGKSATLLNIAYQIKKYNKNFKTKDPTKTPCVVLLTMENSVKETIERLFNLSGAKDEMKNYTLEEVLNILRTDGELYLTDETPIDIIIKYVPGNTVDTGYLYTLTEDLEDDGYEVICMVQDYIKKIRSCNQHSDIRLELGAIVDEFKIYCILKDIPLITASQLNRGAVKSIDEGRRLNKADLVRLIGRDNIGESMLMLENTDCSFLLAVEYDNNGNKYLGLQRTKLREKPISDRTVIYQPFSPGSGIKLIEDFYSQVPVFKETLREMNINNQSNNNHSSVVKQSSYTMNEIKDFDDVFSPSNDNGIFKENNIFGTVYNSNNAKETIDYDIKPIAICGSRSQQVKLDMIDPIIIDNIEEIEEAV